METNDKHPAEYILDFLENSFHLNKHLKGQQFENLKNHLIKFHENGKIGETLVLSISINPLGNCEKLSQQEIETLKNNNNGKKFDYKSIAHLRKCTDKEAFETYEATGEVALSVIKYQDKETNNALIFAEGKKCTYRNLLNDKSIKFYYGSGKPFDVDDLKKLTTGKTILRKNVPISIIDSNKKRIPKLDDNGNQLHANYWVQLEGNSSIISFNDYYLGDIYKNKKLLGKEITSQQSEALAKGDAITLDGFKSTTGKDMKAGLYYINLNEKYKISSPNLREQLKTARKQLQPKSKIETKNISI